MPGSWFTLQLGMVNNIYLYIKIILLRLYCLGAELLLEVALDPVISIVIGVYLAVLKLFQSTEHGEKHICGHQDRPSMMPGSRVTPWSGSGPCYWHCYWCWCISGSCVTYFNQLSMVKNIYLDTKINPLWCQGAELQLEVASSHSVTDRHVRVKVGVCAD